MKRWLIIAAAMLIVIGCRHGGKKEPTDTAAKTPDTTAVADTSMAADTATGGQTQPQRMNIYQDSIEVTNLRLLARKQRVIYSRGLLPGEWLNGTEHTLYLANGTGRMWDTAEDVSFDEAQHFEWTLDSNLLTITCHLELGGILPKRYVVTFADDENLAYNDLYGTAYLWDKKN